MTMQIHCSSSSLHSLIPASSVAVAGSNDFCSILMATFYFPSVFLHSLIRILLQDIPSLPLNDLFTDLYSVGSWTFMWYFSTTSCFGHGNPRPREPSATGALWVRAYAFDMPAAFQDLVTLCYSYRFDCVLPGLPYSDMLLQERGLPEKGT